MGPLITTLGGISFVQECFLQGVPSPPSATQVWQWAGDSPPLGNLLRDLLDPSKRQGLDLSGFLVNPIFQGDANAAAVNECMPSIITYWYMDSFILYLFTEQQIITIEFINSYQHRELLFSVWITLQVLYPRV